MFLKLADREDIDKILDEFETWTERMINLKITPPPPSNFYSFLRIGLKLGVRLDYEMIQGLLFRGYSTPRFDRVITSF